MMKRAFLPLTAVLCATLAAQTPAPKAQTAPDQKAYNAARALTDPDQKLAALHQFLNDYPDSTRKGAAHSLIFTVLLDHLPDRTKDIDEEAKLTIKGDKNYSKWSGEARTAFRLASAEPAGSDLTRARNFAKDALKNETEPKVTKAYLTFFPKGEPAPKPAEVHSFYTNARANALAASAFVAYRQGHVPEATAQLDQAYALAPLSTDVNALRGEIAYAQHRNADALTSFERAQVSGSLTKADRKLLQTLYTVANPNGDLQTALDATYRQLYPEPFTPAPHTASTGGHTALLELYTGSGCPPCVGGDLAVEALLDTHPRTEVIALAYDLHIPKPDPLTSPDTVDRATWDKIRFTPSYLLDGKQLTSVSGAYRDGSEGIYTRLVKLVDEQAAKPSPVRLDMGTVSVHNGNLTATANVTLGDSPSLAAPSAILEAPDPSAKKPAPIPAARPAAAAPPAPRYILNFALVEDDVRYSGENGVRFHRMVVRALAKPSGEGFPLDPGKSITLDTTFDPAAIAAASRTYLDGFEKSNDRFGPMEFLSKDTTMQPAHLAIAAWVQDAETHRILQSAFLPVGAVAAAEAATR